MVYFKRHILCAAPFALVRLQPFNQAVAVSYTHLSLTGVFSGGILLFDGLLLLPAGKWIAGKLGIFLQRFLVQNIYICLFQLALCLSALRYGFSLWL